MPNTLTHADRESARRGARALLADLDSDLAHVRILRHLVGRGELDPVAAIRALIHVGGPGMESALFDDRDDWGGPA